MQNGVNQRMYYQWQSIYKNVAPMYHWSTNNENMSGRNNKRQEKATNKDNALIKNKEKKMEVKERALHSLLKFNFCGYNKLLEMRNMNFGLIQ